MYRISLAILLVSAIFLIAAIQERSTEPEQNRQVTVYNTYGYLDGDEWVIPVRAWVHNPRRLTERLVTRVSRSVGGLNRNESRIFRERIRDLSADSRSRRVVTFQFDCDPEEETYRIVDEAREYPRTDQNGIVRGEIRISAEKAEKIMECGQSNDGWISFEATSRRHAGTGQIQLIEPEGISVISDIDDTIKITEIPRGARIVVRNTFFEEFKPATEMADKYENLEEEWDDITFHYVSGAPWQLYRPLSGFLFSDEAGFPEGTFHMKSVRKNLLTVSSWRDLREVATNEMVTYDQKIAQITRILEHFPDRDFILIGDSGEMDPEVYRVIESRFPDQVEEIYIRDVVNARELERERLDGMEVIPAPTLGR